MRLDEIEPDSSDLLLRGRQTELVHRFLEADHLRRIPMAPQDVVWIAIQFGIYGSLPWSHGVVLWSLR